MRNRYRVALVALVVSLPLLMGPSGGIPSRPRFAAVGVGVAPGAAGTITTVGDVNVHSDTATVRVRTAAGVARGRLQISGADVFLANDNPAGGLTLVTAGGGPLTLNGVNATDFARQSQLNTFTQAQQVTAAASAGSALRVGTTDATSLGYDIAAVRAGNARIGVRNHTDSVEGMMLAQQAAEGVVYGSLTDHRVVIRQNNDDRIIIDNTGAIALNGTGVPLTNGEPVATVISATKAALTSRTSTTTSAADPNLTFALPAGTWEVRAALNWTASTTTTQGARYQINFSGTMPLVTRCTDIRTTLLTTGVVGVNAPNSDSTIPDVSTSNVDISDIRCVIRASTSGTLQVRWAQEASSANATTLEAGSSLYAIRIGS